MRQILILIGITFLPFLSQAEWVVKDGSYLCNTMRSLGTIERIQSSAVVSDYEREVAQRECIVAKGNVRTDGGDIGVYSKVWLYAEDESRHKYYIDTDDLIKVELTELINNSDKE